MAAIRLAAPEPGKARHGTPTSPVSPSGLLSRAALVALALAWASFACAHASDAGSEARRAIVEAKLPELQECWDDLAAEHPGASGSMLFSVELRRNGTVEWVEIEADELGIPKLGACAVRRIKKWRFPEDRRGRSISFGVGFTAS